jgi:hypothetical protein
VNRQLKKRQFIALLMASCLAPAIAFAQQEQPFWLNPGEVLKTIGPLTGDALRTSGWTRQGRGNVYRLDVKAGDALRITLASSSEFLNFAVFDMADPDDDAIFFSDAGVKMTTLTAEKDTWWLIRPILILSAPRRGLGAHYDLTIEKL